MDFKSVINKLTAAFNQEEIVYALIGGFAVSLWGVPRATVDLDFLVKRDHMRTVRRIVESLGYRCIHASENVTQFEASDNELGEIDFLHAFRPASLAMLERRGRKTVFSGQAEIPVIQPEDLIGLKVQAIANNPARLAVDLGDMEGLMRILGAELNWERMEVYFALFSMQELFRELKERYHAGKNISQPVE